MGVLAEYLRTEASQIRAELTRRQELLDEWRGAISKLFGQLEQWVREADGGLGILGVHPYAATQAISEPRLGRYDADILYIGLGGGGVAARKAMIVPKARYVSAVIQPPGRESRRADGIVQITDGSVSEYYLFRLKTEAGDEWFIRSDRAWNADPADITVEPLDRDRFEAALLRVLQ